MTGDVVKLELVEVGSGYRFDPDEILENAKGQGFGTVVVLAQKEDGTLWVSGSANLGETIILMKQAEQYLLFGD